MMTKKQKSSSVHNILFVDDSLEDVEYIVSIVEHALQITIEYERVMTHNTLENALRDRSWDVVLCDFMMPMLAAPDAIKLIQTFDPQIAIILVSGVATVQDAVDMMRLGANAFVEKSDRKRLIAIVEQELERHQLYQKTVELEASLQSSERYYQSIVDEQTELICRFDPDFRLTFVNRTYCEWQGLTAEELIGATLTYRIPEEDRERAIAHVRALTIDNPTAVSIHASVMPDDSVRLVEWTDRAIFDENGEIQEYQGVGRDVTDREEQSRQLQEYRSHFDAILNTMQDALISISLPDRETVFISKAFSQVYGYDSNKFIEDPQFFHKVVHPDDLEKTIVAQQTCLEEGFVEFDHRVVLPDGEVHWIHRRAWISYDENGQPIQVNDSGQDITEQKQAENAIVRSEKRYRQMFEAVNLPKLITDPETAQILDANPAAVDFYGYSLKTLKSMTMLEINMAEPDETFHKMQQVLSGEIKNCLFEQKLSDGTIRDVEGYAASIEYDGRECLYCTYIDVTERNHAQAALEQTNETLEQHVIERTAQLEQSRDRIETIFNHSADGILLLNQDLKIQQSNYAFCELFSVSHEDSFDRSLPEFMSEANHTALVAGLVDIIERHETKRMEIKAMRQNGTVFDAEISIAPVNRSDHAVENIVCIIRDISERKKYMDAVAEERNLLRTVIDAVPDFIYVKDTEHRMILNNLSHARSVGFDPEDLVGKTDLELFPEEMAAKFQTDEKILFKLEEPITNVEERSLDRNGNEIWALTTKAPLRNIQGEVTGLVGITHDVTELVQKEEALRQSEQRLRESEHMLKLVLDTIPVRVFWKDRNSIYLGCNYLFAEDAGLDNSGIIVGKSDFEMPWAQTQAEAYRLDDKIVIESGIPKLNYQEPQLNAEGDAIILETSKIPLRDADGEIFGMLGTYIDITEQKEAEAQLRYLASLQAFMHDSVVGVNMEFRIQSWNHASEAMFGWTTTEAMGNVLFELLRFEFLAVSLEEAEQELSRSGKWIGEVIARHRNGQVIHLLCSVGINRDENGVPIGFIGVNHDITDRKKAEIALAEKLESEQQMQWYLAALHNISLKLARAETLDEFYRTAVSEGLLQLNFDRMTVLLHDHESGDAVGTYGTDVLGNIVAEHQLRYQPDKYTGILQKTIERRERFAFVEDAELYMGFEIIGTGQVAAATLWNGKLLGWIVVDNAIHHQPINQVQLDILALYSLSVGSLLARKQAEIALKSSEERYRMLAENAKDLIVRTNTQSQITYVSPSSYGMLGYQPEEVSGKNGLELIHPDDREQVQQMMTESLHSDSTSFMLEERMRHKDGHYIWVEAAYNIIYDPVSRTPVELIGIIRNISERKAAQEAIQSVTDRLQLATTVGGIGIWDWNLIDNSMFWDDRMLEMYGVTKEDYTGAIDTWQKRVHPEDMPRLSAAINASIEEDTPYLEEFRVIWEGDNKVRHILAQAQIVRDENGKPLRMVGVNMDITDLKNAQITLANALEKEKELGKLKSQFVSTASHQFRTPLAAILSTTETLTVYRERMDDSQIAERLERIRTQVNRMKRLMDDVLELARIQANQIQYKPVMADLNALCNEVIDEFADQPDYRNRIDFEGPQTPLIAEHDPHLMYHIMSNLIYNALKYSKKTVAVNLTQLEDEIIFKVKDEGIGIPAEDIKNLFMPFSRASNTNAIDGTGLGLSIARQSAEAHGGSIEVESLVEVGTTFIVKIPYRRDDSTTHG